MNAATQTRHAVSLAGHPFIARLSRLMTFGADDLRNLERIVAAEPLVKAQDLVVIGDEYRNLCFVKSGHAIRYRCSAAAKDRYSTSSCPATSSDFP